MSCVYSWAVSQPALSVLLLWMLVAPMLQTALLQSLCARSASVYLCNAWPCHLKASVTHTFTWIKRHGHWCCTRLADAHARLAEEPGLGWVSIDGPVGQRCVCKRSTWSYKPAHDMVDALTIAHPHDVIGLLICTQGSKAHWWHPRSEAMHHY